MADVSTFDPVIAAARPVNGYREVLLGVDLVMVNRVAESIATFGDRYLERVYTANELSTCVDSQGRVDPLRLAARFAGKEATIKALGLIGETVLTDIEILTDEQGKPNLRLHGKYRQELDNLDPTSIAISLSHDGPYAIATVVVLASNQRSRTRNAHEQLET